MKRHSSFVLYSEKRNLKDCCGFPLQNTTTRWMATRSNASIFMFSLIGQAIGCCASSFTESLSKSQRRPGAEKFVGFSGTGEMQMEPDADSAAGAGRNRNTASRITTLILKAFLLSGLYAWFQWSSSDKSSLTSARGAVTPDSKWTRTQLLRH